LCVLRVLCQARRARAAHAAHKLAHQRMRAGRGVRLLQYCACPRLGHAEVGKGVRGLVRGLLPPLFPCSSYKRIQSWRARAPYARTRVSVSSHHTCTHSSERIHMPGGPSHTQKESARPVKRHPSKHAHPSMPICAGRGAANEARPSRAPRLFPPGCPPLAQQHRQGRQCEHRQQ